MCKPELALLGLNPREVIFRKMNMHLPCLKGDYWSHVGQNDFHSGAILSMNEVHTHSFSGSLVDIHNRYRCLTAYLDTTCLLIPR